MKQSTLLVHQSPAEPITKAIVPPIHLSTVFAMELPSSSEGFQYGRVGNPTRSILEETLATIQKASHCAVFSSGCAAIATVLSTRKRGDRIICHNVLYEGTTRILTGVFQKFGVVPVFMDITDRLELIKQLQKQASLVWIESPTNPLLTTLNIAELSRIVHDHGSVLACDNTLATGLIQQPLTMGADVVVESLTKALNGHTDAMGGLIATNNKDFFSQIRFLQHTLGAVLSPHECQFILRGIKTLALRLEKQQNTATLLAHTLAKHPAIEQVFFPGFHRISQSWLQKQMKGPGFLISFRLHPQGVSGKKFLSKLRLTTIGHSFGGVETLIQQPTTMMDLSFSQKQMKELSIDDNFFRLSVGIEDCEDILQDITQALAS